MTPLAGVGGSLFPSRYLATRLLSDSPSPVERSETERRRRQFQRWWAQVERSCGPATGLRALSDLVAMPLAGLLGFRARQIRFERARIDICLETKRGSPVALLLLPWASAQSLLWRALVAAARSAGARWCLLVAPPFVSVVDARSAATRRSVDFTFPDAFQGPSFDTFLTLAGAGAFDAGLDRLVARAASFQDRVREDLQHGVVNALHAISSIANRRAAGRPTDLVFDESLTLVYRILFLLFAESRQLVPRDHPIYRRAYSMTTLCRDALSDRAAPAGWWDGLAAITRLARSGCRSGDLIVRPFNGRLFARAAAPSLESSEQVSRPNRITATRDAALGRALVSLGTRAGPGGREEIAYSDLGVEQLGAVYERVLDLDSGAIVDGVARRPGRSAHTLRRKQTGTFYTPQSLAEFVVRRTLAPLVRDATSDAILALRVVDPAMGSGAFLVAACRYLASAYERASIEEGRCSETDLNHDARADIRRLVAENCLAGVDVNPIAVQLARLSLWLTTLARGKPLSFLDHRLRTGNSLVGISPDDLWRRPGRATAGATPLPLFETARLEDSLRQIARPLAELTSRRDDTVEVVHRKSATWLRLTSERSPLDAWRVACHLWCSRWFWPDSVVSSRSGSPAPSAAELAAAVDALIKADTTLGHARVERWATIARALASELGMFHWPLEFADVFYDEHGHPRERAGFDAVIGNPPWEIVRDDSGRGRKANGPGGSMFNRSLVRFVRDSGQYPHCDRGHLNLYQPFLERSLSLTRRGGRVGLVLPWGLAADDGATALRKRLLEEGAIDSLVGLDNGAALFPVHRGLRFAVLVASPGRAPIETRARFGVKSAEDLEALPDVDEAGGASAFPVRLSPETIAIVGGPARRIPDIRRPADLAWLEQLALTHPPLGHGEGWGLRFGRELNATEDRGHFGATGLPVIEGKQIAPFLVDIARANHRIRLEVARDLMQNGRFRHPRLAYRDVSGVANKLSLIAVVLPGHVISTHTVFCLRTPLPLVQQHFLCGVFNSFVLNAVVRLLMGGHVTTSLVENLPVPVWRNTALERRIARLAARLARTRGASPKTGAALQAAVARLYAVDESTFERLLEGFPLVEASEREAALARLKARMML